MQKNLVLVWLVCFAAACPAWAVHDDAEDEADSKTKVEEPVVVDTDRSVECIQSICKPTEGVPWATQRLKKEFGKLVSGIQGGTVGYSDDFRRLALSIEEKIKAKSQLESAILGKPFNPKSKAIDSDVNTLLNMSMMLAMSRALVMNSQFKLDVEASHQALAEAGYNKDVADWLIPAADFYLTPELVEYSRKSRALPAAQYLQQTYGSEIEGAKKILTAYQALMSELRSRKSNLATVMEWQAHAPGAGAILAKAQKGEALTPSEIYSLPKVDVLVRSARRAMDEKSPLRGEFHFDLEQLVKSIGGPEGVVTRIAKQLSDHQAATLRELESCKTNYLYQREIFPTAEQVKQLDTVKEAAKNKLRENVLGSFSKHTQGILGEMLNKTVLYSPPARQEVEERFRNAMARTEASYSESIAFLEKLKGKKATAFRDAFSALATVQPMATSADSLCRDVIMGDFSDAMLHLEGIQLGPALASMDTESQMAGIVHELSHAISTRFREGSTVSIPSSLSYRKLKMCVRDIHPAKVSARIQETAGGVEFTSGELAEEDLADWISGNAVGKTKLNAWCHVMSSSQDGEGWVPSSTVPAEGDHHSGDLFRLIHHEQLRGGQVGEACQETLKKTHGSGNIKSCKL